MTNKIKILNSFILPDEDELFEVVVSDSRGLTPNCWIWNESVGYLEVVKYSIYKLTITLKNLGRRENAKSGTEFPSCMEFLITAPSALDPYNPLSTCLAADFNSPAVGNEAYMSVSSTYVIKVDDQIIVDSDYRYSVTQVVNATTLKVKNEGLGKEGIIEVGCDSCVPVQVVSKLNCCPIPSGDLTSNTFVLSVNNGYDVLLDNASLTLDIDLSKYDNTTSEFITLSDIPRGTLSSVTSLIGVTGGANNVLGNISLSLDTDLSKYDNTTSGFFTASDKKDLTSNTSVLTVTNGIGSTLENASLTLDTDLSKYDNTTSGFFNASDKKNITSSTSVLTVTNGIGATLENTSLTLDTDLSKYDNTTSEFLATSDKKNLTSTSPILTINNGTGATLENTSLTLNTDLSQYDNSVSQFVTVGGLPSGYIISNTSLLSVSGGSGATLTNVSLDLDTDLSKYDNTTSDFVDSTALNTKSDISETASKAQLAWDTPTTTLTLDLLDKYNNTIDTESVLIPITSIIDRGYYDSNTQELVLVLADQSEIRIPASGLISGLQPMITSSNKLSASLVSGLANVATSGDYDDLLNKPTIPTVNDATLTIQKNSTNVGTFTANASSNATINISVPTDTNDLTNGAGYITSADIPALPSNTDLSDYDNSVSGFITSAALPTVNDATLTIQKNSVNVGTFTANASSNATIDISVPTDTGDLTNGAGFITSASIPNLLTSNNTWTGTNTFNNTSTFNNTVQFNEDIKLAWTKNAYLYYIQFMTTADSMSIKMANNNALNFTSPQIFSFRIGSTEKFRIQSDSLVNSIMMYAHTYITSDLEVASRINANEEVRWHNSSVNNSGRIGLASDGKWWFRNGTSGGKYLANGGTAWQDYSDRRMKKNIVNLDSSLDKILALKPVRFDYKTDESDNSARVGFIAQDVYPVIPEAVDGTPDQEDYMGLGQETLIPFLVKAVQELSSKVDELNARIKELETSK